MSRDIVLKYWKIIRYKTLIIQCVPEGTPIKDFVMNLLLESHVLLQERLVVILNV